jgi:hypothetical protein
MSRGRMGTDIDTDQAARSDGSIRSVHVLKVGRWKRQKRVVHVVPPADDLTLGPTKISELRLDADRRTDRQLPHRVDHDLAAILHKDAVPDQSSDCDLNRFSF